MLSDLQIEALTHGCAGCGNALTLGIFVKIAYHTHAITHFARQVELGIIGAGTRNFWVHVYCDDPFLARRGIVTPDIHSCIVCKQHLRKNDVISPVFRVENPEAQNPHDPTDKGVTLGDRVYFAHADCKNIDLTNNRTNILLVR